MAFRLRGLDGDAKAPLPASTPAVLKRVRREMSFMSFLAFAANDTVAWRQPAWIVAPRAECHPAPGVIPREIECCRRRTPTRLFPHAADLPILQFRAMQAAGPGRDRAIAHLFHPVSYTHLTLPTIYSV